MCRYLKRVDEAVQEAKQLTQGFSIFSCKFIPSSSSTRLKNLKLELDSNLIEFFFICSKLDLTKLESIKKLINNYIQTRLNWSSIRNQLD